jgi:predicted helicase
MASYAMAHLKLDLLLTETGYKPTTNQRFRVYLTNSLEEHHQDTGTLFANWLSTEANEANYIKRDTPVMCVIGNPPYAISSTNKNEWIQKLIADYKKDLNERKINLDDDYIKFIRYGQYCIDKNESGILAYISNNSFIDGITHRQMRKNLLESFDKIYILDLHGNAKKKEVCSDGSADQNVFDIMQGVSINIFVKTGKKKKTELGQVFHSNLQGKREFKYETLNANSIKSLEWKQLEYTQPNLFFVPKIFDEIKQYEKGFKLDKLFINYSSGIHTGKDHLVIDIDKNELEKRILDVKSNPDENYIRNKYDLIDTSGWSLDRFKSTENKIENYVKLKFRVFDDRWIIYENKALKRDRGNLMKHFFKKDNLGLVSIKRSRSQDLWKYIFVSNLMTTEPTTITALDNNFLFPLYLYPENTAQQTIGLKAERIPNLNAEIVKQIADKQGFTFTNEKEATKDTFAPIDILDYIYAVLHSPTYREKYKEFLKIDFPRVPYPKDKETFWQLVKLGGEIRQIHLLESPTVDRYITQYPEDGNNIVTKPKYQDGKVYINDTQYFDNLPQVAWEFCIGGYQPAQKWLKDRKGRKLEFDDILHYQKIIVALTETDRLMNEIDKITIL